MGRKTCSFNAKPLFGWIVAGLIQDHNDEVGQRIQMSEKKGEPVDDLLADVRMLAATYNSAIERILGATPETIRFVDFDVMENWFRSGNREASATPESAAAKAKSR